jgi:hypothetical protein
MAEAFKEYLRAMKNMENVLSTEIDECDIGTLIDDICLNMDYVNKLFEHKFNHKLFCPPWQLHPICEKQSKKRGKTNRLYYNTWINYRWNMSK